MTARFEIYYTKDANHTDYYNNWNFNTPKFFDDFKYNITRNALIYSSAYHTIGEESIDLARIRLVPEKMQKIKHTPTAHILGIPYNHKDKVVKSLVFQRALNENID